MKHIVSLGSMALALACASAGQAADATLPLTLAGTGPYYTVDVTLQARQLASSSDLADLRVRNAAGETMPFAWAEAATPPPVQMVSARLYKVPLPPPPASAIAGTPRQAWIVDTKDPGDDLLRLDLGLERDTQGVYTLGVEASDDLQHWHTLQDDAQLVQLQALPQVGAAGTLAKQPGQERLDAVGIDLDNVPARYLRLTTAPHSAIPPLVSATVLRALHRQAQAPLQWSEPIAASGCETTSCDYPLPRNAALAAVQVVPADVDTIAQVMVMGQVDVGRLPPPRHSLLRGPLHALRLKAERAPTQAGMAWDGAAMANVYWLTQASGAADLHSPPVRLDGVPWRMLRLETFGLISQLGHVAPTIRIAVRPRQLVFVARGAGPFVLARMKANEASTPMSLAQLMPGRASDAALPEATANVTATAAPASAAPVTTGASAPDAAPSHTPWLWAALLAGLALMVGMAWSLLRKPRP